MTGQGQDISLRGDVGVRSAGPRPGAVSVLGLELCSSNGLRSGHIFHVHFNTRQIVLYHCMHFIKYGRGNHTTREMSHT